MKGYSSRLKILSVLELEKLAAENKLPPHQDFGLTEEEAAKLFKVELYRKRHDLVQCNSLIPARLKQRLSVWVNKNGVKHNVAMASAIKLFLKHQRELDKVDA